jgi:SAM-dependent methyltransferase
MTTGASSYNASDGFAYETFLGRWTRRLAGALIDFSRFPETGALLDAGCGTGGLVDAMAARWSGRRVVGLDIAEPYIDFARRRAVGNNPSLGIGDLCRLPYADPAFSGVGAQLVLNFVSDPHLAVREMRRVTRSDGVDAAAIWDFGGGLVYQRIFWDTASSIDPKAGGVRDRLFSTPLATPDGLLQLFAPNGLIKLERDSLTIRMDYVDFDDYWRPLLGGQGPVGTYAASLSPDMRARVEDAVRAAYLAGAPDGPRSMTATAWAVRAVVP